MYIKYLYESCNLLQFLIDAKISWFKKIMLIKIKNVYNFVIPFFRNSLNDISNFTIIINLFSY